MGPEHLGHLPLEEDAGLDLGLGLDAARVGVHCRHGGHWQAGGWGGVLLDNKMDLVAVFKTVILKTNMDNSPHRNESI